MADPNRPLWQRSACELAEAITARKVTAAEVVDAVEDQLCEPLLVDPANAVRHRHQLVVLRKAVLDDLAPADERQPAVADELESGKPGEHGGVEGDQDEGERLPDEKAREKRRHEHAIDIGPSPD